MPDLEKWVLHRLYELDQKVRSASSAYEFQSLYSEIHNFCANDLSAFYFDIRKDALYCDDQSDPKRRAARTVMDIVFECLVKWLAPVLAFTAEEAWLTRYPSETGSVHLELFPALPFTWSAPELAQKFEGLRLIRKVMTGALEVSRVSKQIGSSLQAHLTVYLDPSLSSFIQEIDLAEFSITSSVDVKEGEVPEGLFALEDVPGVGVTVTLAKGEKCARCWKVLPRVIELCPRCTNVVGKV